jgi:pyrroline-5-carboxylate reductase
MKSKNIGFIGGGNMSSSLIKGLIASGQTPDKIWVSDIDQNKLQALANSQSINIAPNNDALINTCDVVVLAVKPQVLHRVSEQASKAVKQHQPLIVSIAAGISQYSLSQWLGDNIAIVRCMPNTPALVLTGATALHANSKVSEAQKDLAENILRAVGISIWVSQEAELDAVTAVSGSGPAYFFLLMEAMEKTAVELGLDQQTARLLVQQTALGAAKIAIESTESPAQLRSRVTSPGGTTQKALQVFAAGNFEQLVSNALNAARDRSIEMSNELGDA